MNFRSLLGCSTVALWVLTAPAHAWDTPQNPDLRPSFGFQSGGGLDIHAHQATTAAKPVNNETRDASHQTLNFFTEALVPLSNHWSFQAGAGLISDHSSSDQTRLLGASSTDRTSANASLVSRYYYIGHSLVSEPLKNNPDQWPSTALILTGSDSVYREETDISSGTPTVRAGGINQTLSLGADARLPLTNALTLLVNVMGSFSAASLPETLNANGTETRTKTLSYGAGAKYYWIGQNFIRQDSHANPDRWTSISLVLNGISRLKGHQITTSATTGTDDRNLKTSGFTISSELRIPVTNNLSVRIGMNGGQTTSETPLTKTNGGSKTTTPSFTGFAGFRGYFL